MLSGILKKSDAPTYVATYVAIVNHRCCNYCFCIFHGECCIKHSVHVATGIFHPRIKRRSYFYTIFFMFQTVTADVALGNFLCFIGASDGIFPIRHPGTSGAIFSTIKNSLSLLTSNLALLYMRDGNDTPSQQTYTQKEI